MEPFQSMLGKGSPPPKKKKKPMDAADSTMDYCSAIQEDTDTHYSSITEP